MKKLEYDEDYLMDTVQHQIALDRKNNEKTKTW